MPKPELELTGKDGNAFMILGLAAKAARGIDGYSETEWNDIRNEAESGDYDHLLQTMMKYFEVS